MAIRIRAVVVQLIPSNDNSSNIPVHPEIESMTSTLESAIRDLLKSVLLDVAREVLPSRLHSRTERSPTDTTEERMLLRSSELAELLAISEKHLYTLTQSGMIPCVHVGRLVRYRPDAVREWLRQSESTLKPDKDSLGTRRQVKPTKKTIRHVAPRRKTIAKKVVSVTKRPDQPTSTTTSVTPPHNHRKPDDVTQDQLRSARSFFAARLGVGEDALPRLTNGELMRIAEVDKLTMHGWLYLNRDLPESAIAKLHEYFAAYPEAQR